MKAKLFKKDNDYCLDNELGETIAASWANVTGKKLSQSNCDEIFGVVDVEKLAYDSSQEYLIKPIESPIFTFGYEEGFEKAMELNKDKVFTLEDMKKGIDMCIELMNNKGSEFRTHKQTIIQSLQQPTEIEVEIVTEPMNIDEIREQSKGFLNANTNKPKLDSNGNLILKKI
jgi:hypothetical protein